MGLPTPDEMSAALQSAPLEAAEKEKLDAETWIELDCTDARGFRYQGRFHFRVPTLGQQIEIGRMKAAYLPNGAAMDRTATLLVEQICYLHITLQKPLPKWWTPFEMFDATPVSTLYAEAISYEARFLGAGSNAGSNAGAHSGDPEDKQRTPVADANGAGLSARAASKRRTIASSEHEGG